MPVQMPEIDLMMLAPELALAVALMVILLLGANRTGVAPLSGPLAIGAAVAATALVVGVVGTQPGSTFSGMFVNDPFAYFVKLLMCVATLLAMLMALEYVKSHKLDKPEYYVLSLSTLLGGLVMAASGDFVSFYLGLELMSLSVYVLAAFQRDDIASNEAGLKYFVLGSVASGLLLYGITLIYGSTGTTNFAQLAVAITGEHTSLMLKIGVIMVLAGLSFKIAAAPFHMWAPDVYQGAPTSVTAFMAVVPKIAAFSGIYRVLIEACVNLGITWGPILQLLALVSLVVGAFAAIAQTNIKRMLAYSSIGHVGYILIGVTAGALASGSGATLGYQSVLVYLAIYVFMNLGTFAMVLVLNRAGIGDNIDDYKGLGQKRPMLAIVMALLMFSMAGVPPLAGFIGKLYIFMAAVKSGMVGVAIVGVLLSAVGAFYYLRIVKNMYFDQPSSEFTMEVGLMSRLVLAVSTVVVLAWGVFPGSILAWAEASVAQFH